jgi:hypothetical protein
MYKKDRQKPLNRAFDSSAPKVTKTLLDSLPPEQKLALMSTPGAIDKLRPPK